nr:RecName: Full=U28-ctenitoxin-Pn1a; Short=U28-CNTX-Pn1a; AltName: Full=Spasmogenic toxin PnV1 [Phoneutria nigriventer]
EAFPGQST